MTPRVISSTAIRRAGLALGVGAAICLGPNAARTQGAPASVTIDVGDCATLKAPDERLACFDRHVEEAKLTRDASPAPATSAVPSPAAAPQAGVVAPAPAAAAAPSGAAGAAAIAGASAPPPPPQTAPPATSASAPAVIVATVTDLHETVPNAWLITLDNGQVWRQNIPQRFALKPGQRVTLHGTRWGASYRLSADALNGFIQVERVR